MGVGVGVTAVTAVAVAVSNDNVSSAISNQIEALSDLVSQSAPQVASHARMLAATAAVMATGGGLYLARYLLSGLDIVQDDDVGGVSVCMSSGISYDLSFIGAIAILLWIVLVPYNALCAS